MFARNQPPADRLGYRIGVRHRCVEPAEQAEIFGPVASTGNRNRASGMTIQFIIAVSGRKTHG